MAIQGHSRSAASMKLIGGDYILRHNNYSLIHELYKDLATARNKYIRVPWIPENFRESLLRHSYFSQNFMGFCSDSIPPERALVSSFRPPYILFLYQHSFARNFRLKFSLGVVNPQFWGRGSRRGSGWCHSKERWRVPKPYIHIIPLSALVCPKFYIAVSSGSCEPKIWEVEAVGGRGWYRSKERCWLPRNAL